MQVGGREFVADVHDFDPSPASVGLQLSVPTNVSSGMPMECGAISLDATAFSPSASARRLLNIPYPAPVHKGFPHARSSASGIIPCFLVPGLGSTEPSVGDASVVQNDEDYWGSAAELCVTRGLAWLGAARLMCACVAGLNLSVANRSSCTLHFNGLAGTTTTYPLHCAIPWPTVPAPSIMPSSSRTVRRVEYLLAFVPLGLIRVRAVSGRYCDDSPRESSCNERVFDAFVHEVDRVVVAMAQQSTSECAQRRVSERPARRP